MSRDAGSVVIIGAGIAGFNAATQLRELGHTKNITIVDSEPGSYDRPPLSKNLFDEDFSLERLALASAETFTEKGIKTRFQSQVSSLDPETGTVVLEDGSALNADTVLIASGGRARQPLIPGIDLPGVSVLRTFADALELRNTVAAGTRVAVVGAGLIGAELASALKLAGAQVTLIDPMALPLVPAVGEVLAGHLHSMHEPRGVLCITAMPSEFVEADDALQVRVADGGVFPADRIIVGVGIVPNVEFALDAGLEVDDGIIVDENYRTSSPRIFAAGDVARTRSADGKLERRAEHWDAAITSGQHAAYGMLGMPLPTRGTSWFWSDRHGHHLEATGRLSGSGETVVREGMEHPAVFLIEDGLLQGAASIDDSQMVRAARRIIDEKIPVTAEILADPQVSLRALLRAALTESK